MSNQINPLQILAMIKNGGNPQQVMMSLLQQKMGSTPVGANLMQMVQQQDSAGLESFARNLCAERGIDFDSEFNAFKNNLGF